MKIAICDDRREDILCLRTLIEESRYCPENVEICEYSNGQELLDNYLKFDAVFLDMQMKGMDGKQTAEEIRKRDPHVTLSFYSGFETPANLVLRSRPHSYLMKNSDRDEIIQDIDQILRELTEKEEIPKVVAIFDGSALILDLSDILFISINNKGTEIWLTGEMAEKILGPLKKNQAMAVKSSVKITEYYQQLKDYGFIYANKSYIVNVRNVLRRETYSVTLKGGVELSISRSRKKEFDEGFGKYWKIKKR